ncbi:MAG: hypothetical protein ACKOW9_03405 [Candidatus Paceibacterota bacterium]
MSLQITVLYKKIIFTSAALLLFRVLSAFPLPFLRAHEDATGAAQPKSVFIGGALADRSITALGVMPAIISLLLYQTIQNSLPYLKKINESGVQGLRQKEKIQRVLAAAVAVVSALIYEKRARLNYGFHDGSDKMVTRCLIVVLLYLGFVISTQLAHLIMKKGIGNGVSLILVTSIMTNLGKGAETISVNIGIIQSVSLILAGCTLSLIGLLATVGRDLSTESSNSRSNHRSRIEFRLLSSGATPMILAYSVLTPMFWVLGNINQSLVQGVVNNYATAGLLTVFMYYLFSRFWVRTNQDSVEIANNLLISGRVLKNAKPGWSTASDIHAMTVFTTYSSSLIVGAILLTPILINDLNYNAYLSYIGVSSIIVVPLLYDFYREMLNEIRLTKMSNSLFNNQR